MEAVRTHLAMKNIYIIKHDEEKLHHLNQIRSHELQIEQLKQNIDNLRSVVKSIDQVHLSPNVIFIYLFNIFPLFPYTNSTKKKDVELDRESLLEDRLCLLKKLKVTELRLEMRDVELQAMRHNEQGKIRSIKKQSSTNNLPYRRRNNMTDSNVIKKAPLLSLGSLADGLLKSSQQQTEVECKSMRTYEPLATQVHEKQHVTRGKIGDKSKKHVLIMIDRQTT